MEAKKGRRLVAKHEFRKDDVILEEKALVSSQFSWNELYKYRACEYCLRSLETAEAMAQRLSAKPALVLPYSHCCEVTPSRHVTCPLCQALFCCVECRDAALLQYHQVLCLGSSSADSNHPLCKLQEVWRNMHYPPETSSIMLIAKLIAIVKQSKDRSHTMALFSEFVNLTKNENEQIVHKMLGKQFSDQLELLRTMTSEALFDENLQQWFTSEGFISLFAMIGTNGQGIGSSSVSTWVKNCDELDLTPDKRRQLDDFIDQLYIDMEKESGIFLNCEGSGLYSLQSSCNHSCFPNAEITFPKNDHTLVLVALHDIQPEEEICISYLDECARVRSRHSRQKFLRENYLFTCDCVKCQTEAGDPDLTSSEEEEEEVEEEEENMN